MLRNYSRPTPEMTIEVDWQPISTYPSDGKDYFQFFPLDETEDTALDDDWMKVVPGYWHATERRWTYAGRACRGYSRGYEPTHWAVMPDPPVDPEAVKYPEDYEPKVYG